MGLPSSGEIKLVTDIASEWNKLKLLPGSNQRTSTYGVNYKIIAELGLEIKFSDFYDKQVVKQSWWRWVDPGGTTRFGANDSSTAIAPQNEVIVDASIIELTSGTIDISVGWSNLEYDCGDDQTPRLYFEYYKGSEEKWNILKTYQATILGNDDSFKLTLNADDCKNLRFRFKHDFNKSLEEPPDYLFIQVLAFKVTNLSNGVNLIANLAKPDSFNITVDNDESKETLVWTGDIS